MTVLCKNDPDPQTGLHQINILAVRRYDFAHISMDDI